MLTDISGRVASIFKVKYLSSSPEDGGSMVLQIIGEYQTTRRHILQDNSVKIRVIQ
jgi:hypothetical protein